MESILESTADFNFLFGILKEEYNEDNNINIDLFNKSNEHFDVKQYDLRFSLINEEILELCDAFDKNDVIEIIDALCDILYVVGGAKVYFNFGNSFIKDTVKDLLIKGNNNYDDIKHLFTRSCEILKIYVDKINIERILLSFISNENKKEYKVENIYRYNRKLDTIIEIVFEISYVLNINIMKFFDIVHKSNMSKICNNEDEAVLSLEYYKKDDRYKLPTYRHLLYKDTEYYIMYDSETNKILKNINYIKTKFF